MGLSVGWADSYPWNLPRQWIDVTGLPNGVYVLRVTADLENRYLETHEGNNCNWSRIVIGKTSQVTVLANGTTGCPTPAPTPDPDTDPHADADPDTPTPTRPSPRRRPGARVGRHAAKGDAHGPADRPQPSHRGRDDDVPGPAGAGVPPAPDARGEPRPLRAGRRVPDRRRDDVRQHRHLRGQPVPPLGRRRRTSRRSRSSGWWTCRRCGSTRRAPGRAIHAEAFAGHDLAGKAVLVHTGFDRHWRTEAYAHDNPFLALDAVELLVEAGAAIVGIDSLNIDDTGDRRAPGALGLLLAPGSRSCEHMTNLGAVPPTGAFFTALPIPGRGHGDGAGPGRREGAGRLTSFRRAGHGQMTS